MTTVALVEDDSPFAWLLTQALQKCKKIEIVGTYETGEEALREIPRRPVDMILMDIKLPGMNGIECLRKLRGLNPTLVSHVLILTEHEDGNLVFEALKAGASGYLLKDRISPRQLSEAISDVAKGGAVMSPNIARKVIQHFQAPAPSLGALSKREIEVLAKLSDGFMYKEIASKLSISMDTVRSHVTAIYSKLHVHSRIHAARRYHQRP
jgi:DNA-binding NarL/FixJ family response regulator